MMLAWLWEPMEKMCGYFGHKRSKEVLLPGNIGIFATYSNFIAFNDSDDHRMSYKKNILNNHR